MQIKRDIRFAWTQSNGTLAISQLGDCALVSEDDDECIALAVVTMKKKGVMPEDAKPVRIDPARIPADRTYRAAWCLDECGAVVVDQKEAKRIEREGSKGRG